jgi:hypothetical protein
MNNSIVKKRLSHLNTMSYDDIAKSVARIQIFYDELIETVIEEDVKTQTFDLVSGIGGTLGLFLGLSFLSLVEIFEIALQIIFILYDNSKANIINVNPLNSFN